MVHKRIPDRADEQSKEAEICAAPDAAPKSYGLIGRQEKSALLSQSSTAARFPFTAPHRGLRGKTKQR
jgi:hypothetical protein